MKYIFDNVKILSPCAIKLQYNKEKAKIIVNNAKILFKIYLIVKKFYFYSTYCKVIANCSYEFIGSLRGIDFLRFDFNNSYNSRNWSTVNLNILLNSS